MHRNETDHVIFFDALLVLLWACVGRASSALCKFIFSKNVEESPRQVLQACRTHHRDYIAFIEGEEQADELKVPECHAVCSTSMCQQARASRIKPMPPNHEHETPENQTHTSQPRELFQRSISDNSNLQYRVELADTYCTGSQRHK